MVYLCPIQRRKNQAIGKGSMPGQTKDGGPTELAFKSNIKANIINSYDARRRCRSSGYVVPPKVTHRPASMCHKV